jgi:hypothetical protein
LFFVFKCFIKFKDLRGRCGRDRMVVGFTTTMVVGFITTYVISANHH